VGSTVLNWKGGSLSGTGPHFVFEADEYQNKFRFYTPWSLIVTNIGYDHSDFFPNQESYNETFSTFIKRIPPHGWIVVCADNIQALTVSEKAVSHRITYGFHKDSMYCIEEMPCKKGFSQTFCVKKGENELGVFSLQISGKHNIQNATAVIAFCDTIGMSIQDIFFGLSDFKGTARRMEYIGEYNKAIILDDYAHHPEEIEATLQAVNQKYPQKEKIVVFQPHTFSRTKEFLDGFAQSLSKADAVLLLDVYSSAREVSGEISSNDIVSLINKYYPEKSSNVHTIENAVSLLRKSLDKKTLVITMGAGDVWQVGKELLKK
jgi:UDP-N-acetylmuramate--alanine ligase